jgi:hypothetical protein
MVGHRSRQLHLYDTLSPDVSNCRTFQTAGREDTAMMTYVRRRGENDSLRQPSPRRRVAVSPRLFLPCAAGFLRRVLLHTFYLPHTVSLGECVSFI